MLENQLCDVSRQVDRWLKKYEVNYKMLQYSVSDYRFRKQDISIGIREFWKEYAIICFY